MNHETHKTGTSRRLTRLGIPTALAMLVLPTVAVADAVQWTEAEGGNGHWYSVIVSADMNDMFCWTEARDNAIQRGGHLGTLTSATENAFIQANLPPATAADGSYTWVWIGAFQDADDQEPGEFTWVTGEPWDWTYWGGGAPSNDGGAEDFAHTGGESYGTWNDIYECWTGHHMYAYMIEFEADCNGDGIVDYGQILDGTYADDDGNGVPDCCDAGEPCDGGTAPEGHGWSIEPVQWSQAEGGNGHWYATMCFTEDCAEPLHYEFWPREQYVESVGGHLVTPTSAAEYAFMAQHGLGGHFGGYQDMDAPDFSEPNGGWRWVTGEPFEWTNWGPGEPNNSGGTEHFVGSCCGGEAGNWNDVSTLAWQAVVEFEADCDGDGIVDYGQILDGTYADDDGNGVPDCCDAGQPCSFVDCNNNGVSDALDIANGYSSDCNNNDIPDECDIADGLEADCNLDGVPDSCQALSDCDADGIPDACEILNGAADMNPSDGIPDDCQGAARGACCIDTMCVLTTASDCFDASGSYAGDGVSCTEDRCGEPCISDVDGNGVVDVIDILTVLNSWGGCP
ncbi:MAG: hypothetical protein HOI89_00370 [Phycisphaerae bacterium]|nr:hypothetical protein [Phycisphaerae bacterium]